jgi:hypothetical protein
MARVLSAIMMTIGFQKKLLLETHAFRWLDSCPEKLPQIAIGRECVVQDQLLVPLGTTGTQFRLRHRDYRIAAVPSHGGELQALHPVCHILLSRMHIAHPTVGQSTTGTVSEIPRGKEGIASCVWAPGGALPRRWRKNVL